MYSYKTFGTCSTEILLDIDKDHVINDLVIVNGCSGNTKGISKLVKGMKAEDVIEKLEGIECGWKSTSCPDQVARALKSYLAEVC
ncbi:MAG: TIGR03905 family TSCPD domain-containing protein [Clostridia bacterium]|nr:TIGR03905 family TSCPD domain-containing protein [Clostridia bacterium]